MRPLTLVPLGFLLAAGPAGAQDTTATDTSRVARLRTLEVSVARSPETRLRLPAATGVLDSTAFRGAQLQNGLDETLGRLPGVYAANRFNPSLDQRLAIRGAGARANFGVRGIRILLDGIPQTLPDGQSQLTNVDFSVIDRADVLLGPASALHGNAGGGVIAFGTAMPSGPPELRLRVLGGSFGTSRVHARFGAAAGLWSGALGVSRYQSDGFRRHSATRSTQITAAANRVLDGETVLRFRYYLTDSPEAENPGSLTRAEWLARPDSAAPNNIRRGADKAVTQHQAGVTLSRDDGRGNGFDATLFGLLRDLDNPLATAPPGPASPVTGTFSAIDRRAGGARVAWRRRLDEHGTRLSAGADFQTMRDHRLNARSNGGVPTDTIVADQRESTTEIGPFVSLHLEPVSRVTLVATTRYDRVRFRVDDRFDGDGLDQSGTRTMSAASASAGLTYSLSDRASLYGSVATAFETPTSTELVSQPTGTIGLNQGLGPQRTTTIEAGVRTSGPIAVTATVYRAATRDALIQAREQDGRAVFENAGRLVTRGVDAGIDWRPVSSVGLFVAYTHTDATYADYRIRNGTAVDTLDGNQVPGIPRHLFRAGLSADLGPARAEWEQQIVSRFYADDANVMPIEGWGAGVTNIRLQVRAGATGRLRGVSPFVSVNNVWDRRYVAAATVNGFGGRVYEPAPGRWFHLGVDVALGLARARR